MKKTLCLLFLALLCGRGQSPAQDTFKIMQFNIWHEGVQVPGGYQGIVDQIDEADADFVTLVEVRNYDSTRFCDRIVESLRQRGKQYHSFYTDGSGLISRHPILDSTLVFPVQGGRGGKIERALIDLYGQKLALYTAHLDYLNCTYYDILGYDGSTWKKRPPMTDLDSILANNTLSLRDDAIRDFIISAKKDRDQGVMVIVGGDFNEPSYLDWTEETKERESHQNLVVPWTVSRLLAEAGYVDAYRELYPNPVTHPGYTFPSANHLVKIEKLTWAPQADERARIDYIHYAPHDGLKLRDVIVWGPDSSVVRSQAIKEISQDRFRIAKGVWPSDHKAILATFSLDKKMY